MFAILGSGFGLYGYMPALIEGCGQQVALPERYRSQFLQRPQLARFWGKIQWMADENAALDVSEGIVLALTPATQEEWLPRCLAHPGVKHLFLEKPLGHSPEIAIKLLDTLLCSKKSFRIGYSFRHTLWGKRLLEILTSKHASCSFSIRWTLMAHHFQNDLKNWKRSHSTGGGVVRFYGIQVIALMAEAGYEDVSLSQTFAAKPDDIEQWTVIFNGNGLPECRVLIDIRAAKNKFLIEQNCGGNTTVLVDLKDPFDPEIDADKPDGNDRRVPVLNRLCRSLYEENTTPYGWYRATNDLWHLIEKKTGLEIPKGACR